MTSLRQLRKIKVSPVILKMFYFGALESILTAFHCGMVTAQPRPVKPYKVRCTQCISKTEICFLHNIHIRRCKAKAVKILKDPASKFTVQSAKIRQTLPQPNGQNIDMKTHSTFGDLVVQGYSIKHCTLHFMLCYSMQFILPAHCQLSSGFNKYAYIYTKNLNIRHSFVLSLLLHSQQSMPDLHFTVCICT